MAFFIAWASAGSDAPLSRQVENLAAALIVAE
jgi:hypothetical protein